jgi:hypothetical protein
MRSRPPLEVYTDFAAPLRRAAHGALLVQPQGARTDPATPRFPSLFPPCLLVEILHHFPKLFVRDLPIAIVVYHPNELVHLHAVSVFRAGSKARRLTDLGSHLCMQT